MRLSAALLQTTFAQAQLSVDADLLLMEEWATKFHVHASQQADDVCSTLSLQVGPQKNTEKKLLFWICFNLPGYPKLPQNGSKCVQCSLFSSKFNVFLLFVVRVGSICSTSAADTRKGKGQWRNWWRSVTLLSPTSRSIWPMEILFQNKRHWDAQRFLVELLKLQVLK